MVPVAVSPKISSPAELDAFRHKLISSSDPDIKRIAVCCGTGCRAYGALKVAEAFESELLNQGLANNIKVKTTGCHGFCERGTLVVISPEDILYQRVKVEDVPEIIAETINGGRLIDRLLYTTVGTKERFVHVNEVPFYSKQRRLIFGANGDIDPTSIADYISVGGYGALSKALFEMSSELVVEEITRSGLRGRGGGGFSTGIKWQSTRQATGETKYVICNCDEGDPGAFMDRSLMEGNPHSIIEGMIIAGYAVGAREGFVYIRNEYPLAVRNTELALASAKELGLLGKNILGSDYSLDIRIHRGGGAFVCGESSALMASIEGRIGEPRAKYTRSAEKGLWDRPTVLNNVETLANVPLIIDKGADWYNTIGTSKSKGTKIFSLVGKVNNTGLVEVPMGISLREIIYDIGGGIKDGRRFKAVQTGGPSGGCLPDRHLDLPVDFDELTRAGSMMGSGAMIVMDDRNCMVDIARYFIEFLRGESCGKCVPCREGLRRMHEILVGITQGEGQESDIDLLEDFSAALGDGALCGLGTSAPNPVMSTLKYFRDEYLTHIIDRRCPAGVCRPLTTFNIIETKCPGCGLCVKACPVEAISLTGKKQPVLLNHAKCTKCGACYDVCKLKAVEVG